MGNRVHDFWKPPPCTVQVIDDSVEQLGEGWGLGRLHEDFDNLDAHDIEGRTGFFPRNYCTRGSWGWPGWPPQRLSKSKVDHKVTKVQAAFRGQQGRKLAEEEKRRQLEDHAIEAARTYKTTTRQHRRDKRAGKHHDWYDNRGGKHNTATEEEPMYLALNKVAAEAGLTGPGNQVIPQEWIDEAAAEEKKLLEAVQASGKEDGDAKPRAVGVADVKEDGQDIGVGRQGCVIC